MLSLNPAQDATIGTSKPYEITIQNPSGVPTIAVTGNAKGEIVAGPGNQFTARIIPQANAKGEVTILITDNDGGREDVKLTLE